ncbi:MAG: cytochrome c [Armatimonadetes bacterium]|nr:cytochrome c [Armatimonadota bacterium]
MTIGVRCLLAVLMAALMTTGCGGRPGAPKGAGVASSASAGGYDPQLEVRSPSGTWTVPLSKLSQDVPLREVTVDDPLYEKKKSYQAFMLEDLARYTKNIGAETVVFHCRDGYSLRMPMVTARRAGLAMTFRDLELPEGFGSSKENAVFVGRRDKAAAIAREHQPEYDRLKNLPPGKLTPAQQKIVEKYESARSDRDRWARRVDELNGLGNIGPFHPVITRPDAVPEMAEWEAPDAVRGIEFDHVAGYAGRDYPTGAAENSGVLKGFKIFHDKCSTCHAINGAGGKSGPELNVPVNVTEYWNEKYLVPLILNARTIRANSMMPVVPGVTRKDAELLIVYLKYMKGRKLQY